jgi:ABC-type Fe3+/spermidine/putrescine transport system ATPase subunit
MPQLDVVLTDVCKTFPGGINAVIDFNAEIEHGEFVAMLGPSGCGKTTILRMIGGLEEVTSGKIYLSDKDVTDLPPSHRDTSMMFQSFALFPHRNVFKNVEFSLKMRGQSQAERSKPVEEMLELIGMADLADRFPRDLSGGQQQRVALARALISRPTVLLLDEPLGSLDYNLRQTMMVELKKIQQELGMTFIMVTHSQQEALSMADKVIVMSNAIIQQIGTSRDIYERPQTKFVAEFIGNNNLFSGIVRSHTGSIVVLERDGQLFYVTAGDPDYKIATGSEAHFSVRADRMHTGTQKDMANCIVGKYLTTEYVGSLETDVFEVAPNHFVHVEQHRESTDRSYRVGDHAEIFWPANEGVLFKNT